MQLTARKSTAAAASRRMSGAATSTSRPALAPAPGRRASHIARAADTNLFLNIIESAAAAAVAVAVTTITAEDTDKEIERLKTTEGLLPLGAAVAADAVVHSIPGLNLLLPLLAEPAGAAAGVAYMMAFVLSSPRVDPATLAPEGTLLNAKKADDARSGVRVPFTRIVPTALNVVDLSNDGSSGAGWQPGKDGLPKLPVTSVLAVLGVGGLILEAASHAPVLGLFMPRVLQVAGWLAASGYLLDKRETGSKASSSA